MSRDTFSATRMLKISTVSQRVECTNNVFLHRILILLGSLTYAWEWGFSKLKEAFLRQGKHLQELLIPQNIVIL